ncbi:hypothetical protein IW261DRAFT_1336670 [Armillaria novae-zelandiae]|uniref:Uncharacterized protein n=1 Tax=Armillaria novae-zelandiae TaxID=153914 RepID=A0AA39UAQ0_9AGAR|nr:hypothetical protein IW261DRAFT_1336670 [Armillaria novae-zelandiae]
MSVDAKILQLVCTENKLYLDRDDWEWNGKFEQISSFRSRLNGHWIDVFNPSVRSTISVGPLNKFQTYSFRTAELCTTTAMLYERLKNHLASLPQVVQSATFPYHTSGGMSCFVCERGDSNTANQLHTLDEARCIRCPRVILSQLSGPGLIRHCSAHLLHDPAFRDVDACRFCLNNTGACTIRLYRHRKVDKIDLKKSECPLMISVKLARCEMSTE